MPPSRGSFPPLPAIGTVDTAEKNAVVFFKVNGEQYVREIEDAVRDDAYEYPVVVPFRLKQMMGTRDELLGARRARACPGLPVTQG